MQARTKRSVAFGSLVFAGLVSFGGCGGGDERPASSQPGEIPIVAAPGADVPYQLGANSYGVAGGAFLAKAPLGSETVALDPAQVGKICLTGTVQAVPIPPDGSHPPYSSYWGVELGFNLNQGADGLKNPWMVPSNVVGFWFELEGGAIPPIRVKATPTGKDPAMEEDSCAIVYPAAGDRTEVLFTNMYVQCWNGPQGTAPTDISPGLLDMGFQIAASTDLEYPVDFCLTHLGVITQ